MSVFVEKEESIDKNYFVCEESCFREGDIDLGFEIIYVWGYS